MESVEKFGLFVEILPGKSGLVHTSELDVDRAVSPEDFSPGDRMDVKLLEVGDTCDAFTVLDPGTIHCARPWHKHRIPFNIWCLGLSWTAIKAVVIERHHKPWKKI